MNEGRILALDIGEKRIGVAVSDPIGIIPCGLETISYRNNRDLIAQLKELVRSYNVFKIVAGLPLRLSGEEGTSAKKVRELGQKIEEKLKVPVEYWDERMTSVQAKKYMILMGDKTGKKKAKIDMISATVILQNYLESRK